MKKTTVIVSLGLLTFIVVGLLVTRTNSDSRELSQAEFTAMVQSNLLAKVRVYYPPEPGQLDGVPVMLHKVRGTFYQTDAAGQILKTQGISEEFPFIARVHLTAELEGTGKFMRHVKLSPARNVDTTGLSRLIDTAYTDMKARVQTESLQPDPNRLSNGRQA